MEKTTLSQKKKKKNGKAYPYKGGGNLQFLMEYGATCAVGAVIFAVAAAAAVYVIRTRKKCGACAFCAQRGHCHKK